METPHMHPLHPFQPHPIPLPHLPNFAPAPVQQQVQQRPDSADRARAYKSRNKRPCDFCRYKKAACDLESYPPCKLCIRYNKECTFVQSPAKRRRPNETVEGGQSKGSSINEYDRDRNGSISSGVHFGNGSVGSGMTMQAELVGWDNGIAPFQMHSLSMDVGLGPPEFAIDPAFYQDPALGGFDTFEPMSASTTVSPMDNKFALPQHRSSVDATASPRSSSSHLPAHLTLPFDMTIGEPSLDQQIASNAQIVGPSGESDPYLLSRYRYDQYNEAALQSIRIRKMNDGLGTNNTIPTFFIIQPNALASKAQPPERPETLDKYRRDVEEMVNDDVGKRLIRLFYKYVQPYFPVLSCDGGSYTSGDVREPGSTQVSLLAAIYGHALAFCTWDEKLCVDVYTPPSADALFRIAWLACVPTFHTPSLATLQTLLLLVQRRPTNKHVSDTPFKGVMMSATVSIAQSLGINRDPSDWPLPAWEVKLRRRLAWAVFIQDKWLALNAGRSSLIQADDWDVNIPSDGDFKETESTPNGPDTAVGMPSQHFVRLCELTKIVDDILQDLFTVKATRALHNSLEATLKVTKSLHIRLKEWYQNAPAGLLPHPSPESPGSVRGKSLQHELDGSGSLHLAYITAKIELFRAMLRPRVADTNATAVSALRSGAFAVAKEACEFLEGLNARELEAFWASYARPNFTIASSFMLLLYVTSPSVPDAKECLALLNSWRSLLRIKSRSCDLLNLALLRLDGVFVAGVDRLLELSPFAAQAWNESGQGNG